MSMLRGRANVTCYEVHHLGELTNCIGQQVFTPIPDASVTMSSAGFCDFHIIDTAPVNEHVFLADGWIVFAYRSDNKYISKAIVDARIRAYKQMYPQFSIKEIKEQIIEDLAPKLIPVPSIFIAAINKNANIMFCEGHGGTFKAVKELTQLSCSEKELVTPEFLVKVKQGLIPGVAAYGSTKVALDSQEVDFTISGSESVVDFECAQLVSRGGVIKKLKALAAIEKQEFTLSLNVSSPSRFSVSIPPGVGDTRIERLLCRLNNLLDIYKMVTV